MITCSYDPGDNKLRIRSTTRLDRELYLRVKAAGFSWAPKQDLFVAPAWTPAREDFALELAGEIGDEDTSLVDRAEERAERFEGYQEHRADDAERAHAAVAAITGNIPLGQPVLCGHHSEKRARKDAERIENGMRKAVRMWETSQYWERRAKGALRAAKYRELPGVRHRRIKGLEADLRKQTKTREDSLAWSRRWSKEGLTREDALAFANFDNACFGTWSDLSSEKITAEQAAEKMLAAHLRIVESSERWISHLTNRLAYERAMLEEGGGIAVVSCGFDVQPGGQVLARFGWAVVLRVNRTGGALNSYTVAGKYGKQKVGIEEVTDYRAPSQEDAAKVAKATKLPPLVNYPGEGFRHLAQAEWDKISRWSEFSKAHRVAASETHGAHRLRMAPKEGKPYYDTTGVYITDAPRKDPPAPLAAPGSPEEGLPAPLPPPERPERPRASQEPHGGKFAALKEQLKTAVKVVSADQLFPTPPALAARMVEMAGIEPGMRVLEPSCGTGNLVHAIDEAGGEVFAVEINPLLAAATKALCADFLTLSWSDPDWTFGLECFDSVVMNPPFGGGVDVAHVLHALTFLKPGGLLVGLCAGGPRQEAKLKPLASSWERLPAGTFAGTGVVAVLFTIKKDGDAT